MVFLIQSTQNRDSSALQLKRDELIRATEARNRLIGIERLPEPELESVREKIDKKETIQQPYDSDSSWHPEPRIQRKTLIRRVARFCMIDPSDLLRRAAELTERADQEEDVETRERLLRMAHFYAQIAESEQ